MVKDLEKFLVVVLVRNEGFLGSSMNIYDDMDIKS
jgi:hypothetical protein